MKRFGYSSHHDAALTWCIENRGQCPFGCDKEGAPNCAYNVSILRCDAARATVHLVDDTRREALKQEGLWEDQ